MKSKLFYSLLLIFVSFLSLAQEDSYKSYAWTALKEGNKNLQDLNADETQLINEYINKLNDKKIYKIVDNDFCSKYQKNEIEFDFDKDLMPLKIVNQKKLNPIYNDSENLFIKFELDNCVGGTAYYRDFVFIKKEDGKWSINNDLMNGLKEKFLDFAKNKFKKDNIFVYKDESNYIHSDGLTVSEINKDVIKGKYALYGIDASFCCPEYSGDYEYDIHNNQFVSKNEVFDSPDTSTKNDDSDIIVVENATNKDEKSSYKNPRPFNKSETIAYNAYVDWVTYCFKTKNKYYFKLYTGLGLAFEIDAENTTDLQIKNKILNTLIKSKNDAHLRNKLFSFFAVEPDYIELCGNFVPWNYNKYSEKEQMIIGKTIGKYIFENFK